MGGVSSACASPAVDATGVALGAQVEALVVSYNTYGMGAETSWSSKASGAGDKCRRPGSMARTTAQDRHAETCVLVALSESQHVWMC